MVCVCLRVGAHFLSAPSSLKSSSSSSPLRPLLQHFKPYTQSPPSIKMSTQIVEHIVLFKVKPDTDPSKVTSMVDGLNALSSLQQVLHLTTGPLLRNRSSSFNFTHMLHSRYRSKDDLNAYSAHPSHLAVVGESVLPICDDIMAVDWVVDDLSGPVVPRPGSVMRVTFLKLKEGLEEKEKGHILRVIGGIKERFGFGSIDQLSLGENFSPARAKGFSIASIALFPELSGLEAWDSNQELLNSEKEKVKHLLESVIVLDYVIPSPQSASL